MTGHPHRAECMSSSREKMRRITSRSGGGGSPFLGMSPHKRPDADGEQHSYHSHEKAFSPHGGKAKKRADKRARGGRIGKAGGGALPYNEREPDVSERFPGSGGQQPSAGMGRSPNAASTMGYSNENAAHVPPFRSSGQGMDPESFGAKMDEDTAEKRGGTTHVHKHFHVHKKKGGGAVGKAKGGMTEKSEERLKKIQGQTPHNRKLLGNIAAATARGEQHIKPDDRPAYASSWPEDIGTKRGGRAKHARGGRTKKHSGPINITIGMPHPNAPPGGGMGAAPTPPVPSPSAGGAAPPPPPGGAMGGMPPPGAGGAPPPGMPPGANPMQAQQALGAIAGGGGPLGAGMRARGGKVGSPGLAKNMDHWRGYARKNVEKNTAQERGATGETKELSLATRTSRARGGRTMPDAGQVTGVARKEQAHIHRRG